MFHNAHLLILIKLFKKHSLYICYYYFWPPFFDKDLTKNQFIVIIFLLDT